MPRLTPCSGCRMRAAGDERGEWAGLVVSDAMLVLEADASDNGQTTH